MGRVRLAILGDSPCHLCTAACCRQNGHDYAVLLQGEVERRRFAPFALDLPIDTGAGVAVERVLPYQDGRCIFLGHDNLCMIYEDRPLSCRRFQCVGGYRPAASNLGDHSEFLRKNPPVLKILNAL